MSVWLTARPYKIFKFLRRLGFRSVTLGYLQMTFCREIHFALLGERKFNTIHVLIIIEKEGEITRSLEHYSNGK